jgi:L-gulonate 3-dehydrogenase
VNIIACIGAGSIGRSWATLFAARGYKARVHDADPRVLESAFGSVRESLMELERADAIESAEECFARVEFVPTLQQAVRGACHVQESIVEDVQAKMSVFATLDELVPADTVLASSTSEIPGSCFMQQLKGRDRCLVAHPVNPPHLIPLVEICPTPSTATRAVMATKQLMIRLGQQPILVTREIGGFILNRLQAAVIGEALHLVGEGFCSVEDLDKAITSGLGRRWASLGPFAAGHLNSDGGYAEYILKFERTLRQLTASLETDYSWDRTLIERIDQSCRELTQRRSIRELQLERDRKLIALRRSLDGPVSES